MSDIAIIGMACRFPGGVRSAEEYWSLLLRGDCGISEIPPDRWSLEGFYDPNPDVPTRSYSKWGGFLDDIRGFDAAFFGLSQREAEAMDPQQRLLLEVACEAAQDAGNPLAALRRARTGVFIGASNIDYGLMQRYRSRVGDIQAGTGTALSIIANRISNRLDLSGPSLGVDTACSSSIVALDAACKALRLGDCDAAFAGGVNILLDPRMFITFCRAHMLSPSGRIAAFDARADGFVRGEGAGMVLLKRLEDALADGDRIYALIRACAVNQDGATGTITAPNRNAQVNMLRALLAAAGAHPSNIAYVEAHGTGTPLGDPVEAGALGEVIGRARMHAPLLVGSCKCNIGHLEPAAGIAGLIKAALILRHQQVPPSINFEKPNPQIPFDALGLEVPRGICPLPQTAGEPFALVNSFGFGGTNACALLTASDSGGSHPKPRGLARTCQQSVGPAPSLPGPIPVPLSAVTLAQLRAYAARLADALAGNAPLARVPLRRLAATLALGRDHLPERAVLIAHSLEDLRNKLTFLAEGRDWPRAENWEPPQIISGRVTRRPLVAFAMTGQGGQFWNMGREFLLHHPVFQRFVEQFDQIFAPKAGWSVREVLAADEQNSVVHDPAITPAAMFALQAGLAEVWGAAGITPDLVFGHSFGEVTAAFLGGGIALEDVAHLVDHRGQIRTHINRTGGMAAIGMGAEELAAFLPPDGSIEIGAYNAPTQVTVSGENAAIDALIACLKARDPNILAHKLDLDFAWHSSWLEPGEQIFKDAVGEQPWRTPRIPVVSTVTGRIETCFDTDYWWQNLRQPVRFDKAVELALDIGAQVFVELGPHRTLSSPIAACAAARGKDVRAISTLHRQQSNFESFAVALGELYCAGLEPDWRAVLGPGDKHMPLPPIPWAKEALWLAPEEARRAMFPPPAHALLGTREDGPKPSWAQELTLAQYPFLAEHKIGGDILFPAAAYIEMMRAAAVELFGEQGVELQDLRFPEALALSHENELQLRTEYCQERARLSIFSRVRDGAPEWTLRAEARVIARPIALQPAAIAEAANWQSGSAFYEMAAQHGYSYGPAFQCVTRFAAAENRAFGEVSWPAEKDVQSLPRVALDPRALDGCLQLLLAASETEGTGTFLPANIERVLIAGTAEGPLTVSVTCVQARSGEMRAEIDILNTQNKPLLRIEGLNAQRLGQGDGKDQGKTPSTYYLEHWELLPSGAVDSTCLPAGGRVVVIGMAGGAASRLLASSLRAAGVETVHTCVEPAQKNEPQTYRRMIETAGRDGPVTGVLYALPLDQENIHNPGGVPDVTETHVLALTAFGRALSGHADAASLGTVAVLTRNARKIDGDATADVNALTCGALFGLARTIAVECPRLLIRLIDMDDSALAQPVSLICLLSSAPEETEAVIRGQEIFVPRLRQCEETQLPRRQIPARRLPDEQDFALRQARRGMLDSLQWEMTTGVAPAPDEAVVKVVSAGLNFRDVMAATGLLPIDAEPDDAVQALGLEFAGVVVAAGPDALGIRAGDRVCGMARGSLRRYLSVCASQLHLIPDFLSFTDAAALFSAYLTAHYALNHLARLKAGETVLIHSATGGVGLAAINLAHAAGAEIFATAGSEAKRDYARALGIRHVMDSRSLDFADEMLRLTGGRGVDVLLNTLPGPFIEKGLSCLAPYGRFLELGKRDVYADSALGLKALRRNISLHVIDLAAFLHDRPHEARKLTEEILDKLREGTIDRLPSEVFPASCAAEAFQHFARAEHIGKIVIDLDDQALGIQAAHGRARFDPHGTYLVSGGTRGFGLAVGRWLAEAGAGRVVLTSRSGKIDPAAQPALEAMRGEGREIEVLALDVSDENAVEQCITNMASAAKPLKGIVHAAAVYDDALLANMTPKKVQAVLAPKVRGGWALTKAVEKSGARLDFFVSLSSLAQALGWAGQANYTAANAFLEALAKYQRASGIPGVCVNLGALKQSGFVARSRRISAYLESTGMRSFSDAAALKGIAGALSAEPAAVTFADVNWSRIAATQPVLARSARLRPLMEGGAQQAQSIRSLLANTAGPARQAHASALVREQLAKVLRVDKALVDSYPTMADAGLDSLSAFELRIRIESELGLPVPLARFTQAATVADLAALVCEIVDEHKRQKSPSESERASGTLGERFPSAALLPRQREALSAAALPMTSDWGKAAVETRLEAAVDARLDPQRLHSAWAAVASAHAALRLRLREESSGAPLLESGDEIPPLLLEQIDSPPQTLASLHAFAGENRTRLLLRLSRAVGDRWTAAMLLEDTLRAYQAMPPQFPEPENALDDFLAAQRAELTLEKERHLAFWRTLLREPPEAIYIPKRRRALAPIGLGLNLGPPAVQQFKIRLTGESVRETMALAAFARAIGETFGRDRVLIACELNKRGSEVPPGLAGPVSALVPMAADALHAQPVETIAAQFDRDLEAAHRHAAFDLAALAQVLAEEWRAAGAAPWQAGFAYFSQADKLPALLAPAGEKQRIGKLDVMRVERGFRAQPHDFSLTVFGGKGELQAELDYDTDAVSDKIAQKLCELTEIHLRASVAAAVPPDAAE